MSRPRIKRKYMFKKLEFRPMESIRSVQKIIDQINQLLDELEVLNIERQIATEAITGKASLVFIIRWTEDTNEYSAYIQKSSTDQKDLANNIAAIHLWLSSRCLNIRRGVETPAEAFGSHLTKGSNVPINWGDHLLGIRFNLLEAPK